MQCHDLIYFLNCFYIYAFFLHLQFFPHFFNTAANQEHVGAYPPPDMYGCDYMHPKDREEFYDWYHRTRDGLFDFKKEMVDYCRSDVSILRQSALKFRQIIFDMTSSEESEGIEAFSYMTIASVALGMFKNCHLQEDTIAILPQHGYMKGNKRYSMASIAWLEWEATVRGVDIQHILNNKQGEHNIFNTNMYADGFVKPDDPSTSKGTVYEFYG